MRKRLLYNAKMKLIIVMLTIISTVFISCDGDRHKNIYDHDGANFKYEVTGTAGTTVDITYIKPSINTFQLLDAKNTQLPWNLTEFYGDDPVPLYISATNTTNTDPITVSIYKNNQIYKTATSITGNKTVEISVIYD